MYAAERRQKILEMILDQPSVEVADLAQHFGVSTSTIRRDLNDLHAADLLRRTYGGAVRSPGSVYEAPFSQRKTSHDEEKHRIGKAAAQLVETGETVILDGGTTVEYMAVYLRTLPRLTVVTFGLNIIEVLAGHENITVIVIGGTLQHHAKTFGGVLADEAAQVYNMRFGKAFIAAGGVSAEDGITNASFEQIPMKRRAIESSREVILLADSSKIGISAMGVVAPVAKIQRLITGTQAPLDEVQAIRSQGVLVDLV